MKALVEQVWSGHKWCNSTFQIAAAHLNGHHMIPTIHFTTGFRKCLPLHSRTPPWAGCTGKSSGPSFPPSLRNLQGRWQVQAERRPLPESTLIPAPFHYFTSQVRARGSLPCWNLSLLTVCWKLFVQQIYTRIIHFSLWLSSVSICC